MSEEINTTCNEINNNDWFLQNLVNTINGTDSEFGITLNVGGFLVSGFLVSGHKYFEGFADEFCSGLNFGENKETVYNDIKGIGSIYTQKNDNYISPPLYIHLQNTKFYNTNGNPIPNNRGVWWRGRISEVSGFTLGVLSQS